MGIGSPASVESLSTEQLIGLRELWKSVNREAMRAYNELVEKHGTFADDLRGF